MVGLTVFDLSIFVALVEPIFLDPINQCPKDFQASRRESLPHRDDASFQRIIGLGEIEAKIILVDGEQLCTVFLASATGCGIDNAGNP